VTIHRSSNHTWSSPRRSPSAEGRREDFSSPNRPPRAYKRPCAAPNLASHRPSRVFLLPRASKHHCPNHHCRPPPDTAEPPPQAIPAQGEHGVEIPSIPPPFSPFPSRRRPLGRHHPPPAEAAPALLCSGLGGRGGRRRVFSPYPLPFSLFPTEPPPLYSLSLFLPIRP
jgi:hypothetical protein